MIITISINSFVPITCENILSNVPFYDDISYDILHIALIFYVYFVCFIHKIIREKGKKKKEKLENPEKHSRKSWKKAQGGQRSLDLVRRDHNE